MQVVELATEEAGIAGVEMVEMAESNTVGATKASTQ